MSGRQSKFLMWINYRIRVTIQDERVLIGTFLAFDKHMNLVLADTEEYSHVKSKNKKNDKKFARFKKKPYLCIRNHQDCDFHQVNIGLVAQLVRATDS